MDEELDEYRNEKESKRQSLMTQEEIKEADMFLRWFRKSYEDKLNKNLISKWEEMENYWEGDLDEPVDDNDPCSNTNITNSNVEGKVALLCDQNLAMQVDPIEPSDRPFCNRIKVLADFIKEKNKMFRKIDIHERRREKMGTGIFRVLWETEELDNIGLPVLEPVNPAYVFVDPAITDVYKIQKGKYIIETMNKSIYNARLKYGNDVADAIVPGLNPITGEYKQSMNEDEEQYMHMFIWCRYRDEEDNELKLRLIEMSGCGLILRDTKKQLKELKKDDEEIRVFPSAKFPYFFTPDMYREGTIWGKGSAELILPISDQIDDIDNQILMNARLTGNPQRLISNSSGIDADKITNEPGLVIPTNDINGSKWEMPPSIPQYILNKRNELMLQDRTIVGRFNDQQIGMKQRGVDTATESLALQQAGNSMIEHKKGLLQETLSEVFEYAIELALINWDSDMMFRITGKNGEETFESFNPSNLNNIPLLIESDTEYRNKYKEKHKDAKLEDYEYMQVGNETRKVKYDLRVTVGAGMPSNKAFRYNIIMEAYAKKLISSKEARKYLIETLGLNISEVPESIQEQQQIGIFENNIINNQSLINTNNPTISKPEYINQDSGIQGINANGNVELSRVKGGV